MSQRELDAATAAIRRYVDGTAYGGYIDDHVCKAVAAEALKAAETVRAPNSYNSEARPRF